MENILFQKCICSSICESNCINNFIFQFCYRFPIANYLLFKAILAIALPLEAIKFKYSRTTLVLSYIHLHFRILQVYSNVNSVCMCSTQSLTTKTFYITRAHTQTHTLRMYVM